MSHWAEYIKELYGKYMLEYPEGFATYYIIPGTKVCYIEDIYVVPEARETDVGTRFEKEISEWAKTQDCTELMGSVNLGISNPERSIAVLIARGFKLTSSSATMLYFKKHLDF